jgi:hypothetical protein
MPHILRQRWYCNSGIFVPASQHRKTGNATFDNDSFRVQLHQISSLLPIVVAIVSNEAHKAHASGFYFTQLLTAALTVTNIVENEFKNKKLVNGKHFQK